MLQALRKCALGMLNTGMFIRAFALELKLYLSTTRSYNLTAACCRDQLEWSNIYLAKREMLSSRVYPSLHYTRQEGDVMYGVWHDTTSSPIILWNPLFIA